MPSTLRFGIVINSLGVKDMQDFLKPMAENCAICKELSSSYIKPVQLQALERAIALVVIEDYNLR